jgi:hypothetical protein
MRQLLSTITFSFFSQADLRSFPIAHIHMYFPRFYPKGIFGGAIRFIDVNSGFDQGGVLISRDDLIFSDSPFGLILIASRWRDLSL